MDRRGPRSSRRRAGFRGLSPKWYTPRRGPAKAAPWNAFGIAPVVKDANGTPIRRGPMPAEPNLANVARAKRKAERKARRGPTKAERIALLRAEPALGLRTNRALAIVDRDRRRAARRRAA